MPAYCVPKLEAKAMTAWGETWDDALHDIEEYAKRYRLNAVHRFVVCYQLEDGVMRSFTSADDEANVMLFVEKQQRAKHWAEMFPPQKGKSRLTTESVVVQDSIELRIQGFGALEYPEGGPKEWQTR